MSEPVANAEIEDVLLSIRRLVQGDSADGPAEPRSTGAPDDEPDVGDDLDFSDDATYDETDFGEEDEPGFGGDPELETPDAEVPAAEVPTAAVPREEDPVPVAKAKPSSEPALILTPSLRVGEEAEFSDDAPAHDALDEAPGETEADRWFADAASDSGRLDADDPDEDAPRMPEAAPAEALAAPDTDAPAEDGVTDAADTANATPEVPSFVRAAVENRRRAMEAERPGFSFAAPDTREDTPFAAESAADDDADVDETPVFVRKVPRAGFRFGGDAESGDHLQDVPADSEAALVAPDEDEPDASVDDADVAAQADADSHHAANVVAMPEELPVPDRDVQSPEEAVDDAGTGEPMFRHISAEARLAGLGENMHVPDGQRDDGSLESDHPSPTGENLFIEDGAQIDMAQLTELVSECVHRELQGELGERITRNVRKLVRREIHRALSMRDYD
ncbi:hypothetical protein [Tropicimonas marinistellae]|uniref:hypothetical protein n=1 Tax=Tropicimonas marinistellae TaxID=1739787 RepID=UPI00082F5851|nr:hypothetical protein [Tropicimonas marinistellae]